MTENRVTRPIAADLPSTSSRPANGVSPRAELWAAQLELRRRRQQLRRMGVHAQDGMATCPLCKSLDALSEAEAVIDEIRRELP